MRKKSVKCKNITTKTASLATKARTSAQETTPGHFFSRADLAASTTSYPLRDKLGIASLSASLFGDFKSTEPSHPYMHGS